MTENKSNSVQDSWQGTGGNWKKDKKLKDDEDFGKGRLGVRPRKIDPSKAMDMELDPFTSNYVKVGREGKMSVFVVRASSVSWCVAVQGTGASRAGRLWLVW